MYLEGSDQHRGWFHSSLLQSCGTRGRAPFDKILSHGFVVDGKGMKMSKSAGNVILPEEILKNYGADILRVWVAASDYSEDLRIDKVILAQHAESYRKIRNTFRYLLGNIKDKFEKQDFEKIDLSSFDELEKYILCKLFYLKISIDKNFNDYNFHKLYKELLNFCTLDLSSFYFDIRKDVLYCDSFQSKKRKNCVITLNIILECLLKWFAPILAFTTEEISNLVNPKSESIHLSNFDTLPETWNNPKLKEKWESLYKIKEKVNIAIEEKRTAKEIGSSLEALVEIKANETDYKLLSGIDLQEYLIVSKATLSLDEKIEDMNITVKLAVGDKCSRCWKIVKRKMRKMRDGKKITGLMNTENTFIKLSIIDYIGCRFSSRQIVKNYILNYFKTSDTEIVVNRYLNFDLIWNSGVAFGFFSFNDILAYQLMTVLIAIIIIFLIYFFFKSSSKEKLFFALVIGGAAGNLFDRLIYFSVPDFIDLHYRGFHWFTFNIADIFITIGIICILFYEIFKKA